MSNQGGHAFREGLVSVAFLKRESLEKNKSDLTWPNFKLHFGENRIYLKKMSSKERIVWSPEFQIQDIGTCDLKRICEFNEMYLFI